MYSFLHIKTPPQKTMGSLKKFLKSVERQKAIDAFRSKWMADKFALHPDLDCGAVYGMYLIECNRAIAEAGLYQD